MFDGIEMLCNPKRKLCEEWDIVARRVRATADDETQGVQETRGYSIHAVK
nr:hypothetical protein [Paracoccus aminovorans]